MSRTALVICMALALVAPLQAQTQPTTRETFQQQAQREYERRMAATWQQLAKEKGWSAEDIARLAADRIVIGSGRYRQIFEPYLGSLDSFFITSDSLLNAYHVLYEDSYRHLEVAQAARLARVLHGMWDHLDRRLKLAGDLDRPAHRRARILLGTALLLLKEPGVEIEPELRALVGEEIQRINDASAIVKPQWLGEPTADLLAIDYSQFKPRGFYAESPVLSGYFQAVSWLQAIPFHIENDTELASFALLSSAAEFAGDTDAYFQTYREINGRGDDMDVVDFPYVELPENTLSVKELPALRQKVAQELDRIHLKTRVNDQLSKPATQPATRAQTTLRFIAAVSMPEDVLLQKITGAMGGKYLPGGLAVAAALNAPLARDAMMQTQTPEVLKAIASVGSLVPEHRTLYEDYLYALQVLVAPVEKDAPPQFSNDAWKLKSIQTLLASWAQARHTRVLEVKRVVVFGVGVQGSLPPDFVEPNPEFFSRMANLESRTEDVLRRTGVFDPTPPQKKSAPTTDESDDIAIPFVGEPEVPDFDPAECKERWDRLHELTRRLETLAHKQLRGVDFNDEEHAFIRHYGEELAFIMLYGGNSYESPRDDAPRIVDIFTLFNAANAAHPRQFLEVGVGRARQMWILYPWHGKDYLCRGAVMPYFEFASDQRLTDAEFQKMLDSAHPPDEPSWVKPIENPRVK